jgi:hypothetical protein
LHLRKHNCNSRKQNSSTLEIQTESKRFREIETESNLFWEIETESKHFREIGTESKSYCCNRELNVEKKKDEDFLKIETEWIFCCYCSIFINTTQKHNKLGR